jgi:hypothetical protein
MTLDADPVETQDVAGTLRFPAPVTVTIPLAGGVYELSTAVDLSAAKFIGIIMPATWVTAVLTFQVCPTINGTFTDLYDDNGVEVSVSVAQGKAYTLNVAMWKLAPWRYVKFRSGTTATPVDQTASRAITVVLKP